MRSERDKEKTKMRKRDRRAITTNIFRGLRKHGGYPLRARADINQVLPHLAAGWVIESDGTTYRPFLQPQIQTRCPHFGSATSASPTPTSSIIDPLMPTSPINLCLEDSAAAEAERYSQLHSHQRDPHNDSTMQAIIPSEQQIPTSFCVVDEAQPQQQTHLPVMSPS